ncbi:hypothetical protein A2U01_0080793, partial [Trifolium medium]|nr:hypothetical protein [Trifolium medium]
RDFGVSESGCELFKLKEQVKISMIQSEHQIAEKEKEIEQLNEQMKITKSAGESEQEVVT